MAGVEFITLISMGPSIASLLRLIKFWILPELSALFSGDLGEEGMDVKIGYIIVIT